MSSDEPPSNPVGGLHNSELKDEDIILYPIIAKNEKTTPLSADSLPVIADKADLSATPADKSATADKPLTAFSVTPAGDYLTEPVVPGYDLPQPQIHYDSIFPNSQEEPSRSSFTQTFLRGILSSLESKDPVVANAWLETLLDAIDLLPVEVIRQEIISIAVAKGELSQPVSSRLASCQILGKLATKLDMLTVRQEILPVTLSLSQDIQWEVRRCMCSQLSYISRGVGLDLTKSAIIPVLVELSNDKSVAVRIAALETVVQLLSLLDDDICSSTIVPLVIKCCETAKSSEDGLLAVISKQLGALCHGLGPNLSNAQKLWFVRFYEFLATMGSQNLDPSGDSGVMGSSPMPDLVNPMPDLVPRPTPAETVKVVSEASIMLAADCRQSCGLNLPGLLLFAGDEDECADAVTSVFSKLVRDPAFPVRATLASGLGQLVWILGGRLAGLKDELVMLFNDTEVGVLTCMVNAMVFVIDALARYGVLDYGCTSVYGEQLGFAILHMEATLSTTRDWRLHSDCLEKISCLANCLSSAMIHENFVPMLFTRATKSRPLPVRVAGVRTLLVILRFTIKKEDRDNIFERITSELLHGKSCHTRQLFLKLCEMSLMLFSKKYFKNNFFKSCIQLYKDRVPNVRLGVVSLLPQLRSTLSLPEDALLLSQIEEAVKELLLTEVDRDVLAALQASIGTMEEADLASLPGFQGKEDERKEREEQLILSMESQQPTEPDSPSPFNTPRSCSPIQSLQPAATARLRTLAAERKRSESLPPTLKRRPLERLMSAPTPALTSDEAMSTRASSVVTAAAAATAKSGGLWRSDSFDEGQKQQSGGTFRLSGSGSQGQLTAAQNTALDNLDPNAHEFLVDAGVILTDNTIRSLSAASSLPNLSISQASNKSSLLKVASEKPEKSSLLKAASSNELNISNCLISNEEMEHYEKEYQRAASTSPKPYHVEQVPYKRSLSASKIHMMRRSNDKPSLKTNSSSYSPSPTSSPRSSPKFSLRSSLTDPSPAPRRWNDGTIERMAEKWAAKRDTLRRETGFVPENIQGRKAAMEQKLESVKRSIPRGTANNGSPLPQHQKRLSLCNDSTTLKKSSSDLSTPKRSSLDFETVFNSSSDSNDEGSPIEGKLKSTKFGAKLPSPDFDSSDSDDSLPPYPPTSGMEKSSHSQDFDDLLPPPPPDIDNLIEDLQELKNLKIFRPQQDEVHLASGLKSHTSLKGVSSELKSISTPHVLPQKSLTSYYKTVPAPHTSVAVSKTLPSPRRSIAGSLKSPADLKLHNNSKLKVSDEKQEKDNQDDKKQVPKDDFYIEPNNNVIKNKQVFQPVQPSSEFKKIIKTEFEPKRTIKTFSKPSEQSKDQTPSSTSLEIVDQVQGPSQVVIKSNASQKHLSRGLRKPGAYISLQEKDSDLKDSLMEVANSPKKISNSTLPRSRLSAGSKGSAQQQQRRSYGGPIDTKLVSSPNSGLRFSSAPSTPRSSTSDLRSLRSPGRSPSGSTTNLRKSSNDLTKPRLTVNSKPTSQESLASLKRSEITITSFEKQKSPGKSLMMSPKPSRESSNITASSAKKNATKTSKMTQRYSLELKDPKPVHSSKSIGDSLDFTSNHHNQSSDTKVSPGGDLKLSMKPVFNPSLDKPSSAISGMTNFLSSSKLLHTTSQNVDAANSMAGKHMSQDKSQSKHNTSLDSVRLESSPMKSHHFTSDQRSLSSSKLVHQVAMSNPVHSPKVSHSSKALNMVTASTKVSDNKLASVGSSSSMKTSNTVSAPVNKPTNSIPLVPAKSSASVPLSSSKLVQDNSSRMAYTGTAKISKLSTEVNKDETSMVANFESTQPSPIMKSFAMRFNSKLSSGKPTSAPQASSKQMTASEKLSVTSSSKLLSPAHSKLSPSGGRTSSTATGKQLTAAVSSKLASPAPTRLSAIAGTKESRVSESSPVPSSKLKVPEPQFNSQPHSRVSASLQPASKLTSRTVGHHQATKLAVPGGVTEAVSSHHKSSGGRHEDAAGGEKVGAALSSTTSTQRQFKLKFPGTRGGGLPTPKY